MLLFMAIALCRTSEKGHKDKLHPGLSNKKIQYTKEHKYIIGNKDCYLNIDLVDDIFDNDLTLSAITPDPRTGDIVITNSMKSHVAELRNFASSQHIGKISTYMIPESASLPEVTDPPNKKSHYTQYTYDSD
jgi:hypothetical protein